MKKVSIFLIAIVTVVLLPFVFKRTTVVLSAQTDDVVVVITPHNEAVRLEMELGFREWYLEKTGRTVSVDWRVPGSSGLIIRYLHSTFESAFKMYWENTLHRKWNGIVRSALGDANPTDELTKEARDIYLKSNVSCGVDVMYGGGVVEYKKEAELGNAVPCDLLTRHPEWFSEDCIPDTVDGDRMYDECGAWFAAGLSSFGIMYNTDRIHDLNLSDPIHWSDLAEPGFYRKIAMVDPVQSGIVIKCLEMVIQQKMREACRDLQSKQSGELTKAQMNAALNRGWMEGMQLIQRIMANSRYFTGNSVTTIWDVSQGNCAVGVVVDFYGRHQRAATADRGGKDRIRFVMPKKGSCLSPQPICLLRGAKNRDVAQAFIEYVMSREGQARLIRKVGVKGGPRYYALHGISVRKDSYTPETMELLTAPESNPFAEANDFVYEAQWTAPAFGAIRELVKVLFMHCYDDLSKAWEAICKAEQEGLHEQAQQALAIMSDMHGMTYDWVFSTLKPLLATKDSLKLMRMETALTRRFCDQYQQAYWIASQR